MAVLVLHGYAGENGGPNGYRVLAAGHGFEGLRLNQNHRFDVTLMDLIIPDTDGIEMITTLLKESPQSFSLVCSSFYATTACQTRSHRILHPSRRVPCQSIDERMGKASEV
jgi:CheY-like chemotaxis protein